MALTTVEETIRSRLISSLALHPSSEWLESCVAFLRNNSDRDHQPVTVDTVLYQALYSDLRDVVRVNCSGSSSSSLSLQRGFHTAAATLLCSNHQNHVTSASQQLHQGIDRSLQAGLNYKYTLPKTFALLCQIEELLDTSLNTEKRFEVGPVSSSSGNTTTIGNTARSNAPNSRCLKLLMTDGYSHYDGNESNAIIGMEIAPLPNLTTRFFLAGTKVLLQGSITIRHGILLLHAGNCIVIGGCVQELVEHQVRALEKAKQVAGVGVDPTIRALIGTTNNAEDDSREGEDAADEAHVASGDVVAPPPPPPPQQQPVFAPTGCCNHTTTRSAAPATDTTQTYHAYSCQNIRTQQQQSSTKATVSSTTRSVLEIHNAQRNITNQQASVGNLQGTSTSSTTGGMNTVQRSNPQNQMQRALPPPSRVAVNPYAISWSPSSSGTATVACNRTAANPYSQQRPTQSTSTTTSNPYLRDISSLSTSSVQRTTSTVSTAAELAIAASRPAPVDIDRMCHARSSSNKFVTLSRTTTQSNKTTLNTRSSNAAASTNATGSSSAINTQAATTISSSSLTVQNVTFTNLRQLLLQLVDNREMYESYYNQHKIIFRVHLTKDTGSQHFDCVKVKTKKEDKKNKRIDVKGNGEKRIEYFISAQFEAVNNGTRHSAMDKKNNDNSIDHLISCRIHPSLLDPHFDIPAVDLRAMSRTNRVEGQRITNEGGGKVRSLYFQPCYWNATLNLKVEELFGNEVDQPLSKRPPSHRLIDLKEPILVLNQPEITGNEECRK